MKKLIQINLFCFVVTIVFLGCAIAAIPIFSGEEPYDSSKSVVLSGFQLDSGGLATKVFITGSNFGSDLTKTGEYFTSRIGSDCNHFYAVTQRMSYMYVRDTNNIVSVN